jgi:hypothetical protein
VRLSAVPLFTLIALALIPAAASAAPARTVARCDAARADRAAGLARSLSACGRVDLSRGAEGAARQALGRLSGALGVKADTSDLRVMRVSPTGAGPRVRFQQYAGGVPVHDGQVAVALGRDGSVTQIGSSAARTAGFDATASVSRARALLTARRRVPSGFDLVAPASVQLVAEPRTSGALEPAWLVVLPVRAPRGDWNVVVSARSGDVLDAYNMIKRVDGTAQTWQPNPVQELNNTDLRDVNDGNTTTLTNARRNIALTDLNSGTNLLRGQFVDTAAAGVLGCTLPYVPGQASSATRNYNFTRAQDAFEETVAYAAIDRVQRSYVDFGFPGIFSGPMKINVHCIEDDNSNYSDVDNAMHMGDGGVDDAEDADVIVHEFGHATQNNQVPGYGPGFNTEQRAMGEGFGDFLATYTYLQDGDPTYQAARRFCVMEWDATSYNPVDASNPGSGCLRWVDGRDEGTGADIGTYSGTPDEEHNDGRYWDAMLTCVFTGIEPSLGTAQARNRMLTLVLAHNFDLVPTEDNTAFADSLAALRSEDRARFNGDELALINQCGQQRLGIAPPPDDTPPEITGALAPATPDGANGWYRTAPAVSWTVTDPDSTVTAQQGCGNGTDPADTPGKTITCTATSGGGSIAKSLSYKKDSTPPALRSAVTPASPLVGQPASAVANAVDATSGVIGQSCGALATSSAGTRTVTCTAEDAAGNQASQTVTYKVVGFRPKASKPKVAKNGNVSLRLTANATGTIRIVAKAGKVKFKAAKVKVTAGKAKKVTLKLSAKARKAFNRKLRGGKRVKITLTVTPPQSKKKTLTIKVRRH